MGKPILLTIVTDGHPTLRKVARKVDEAEIRQPAFQQLIDDMFHTMYEAPGIGLAAPQVDVSKRLMVVDLQDDESQPYVFINPKIVEGEGEVTSVEGCLSVPGTVGDVSRYAAVTIAGLDRRGRRQRVAADGLLARCLQHELDHLDGVLYVDKATNVRPAVTEEEQAAAQEGGVAYDPRIDARQVAS
ncbi:MAG TPA: peptide deformylase [Candidatus Dormibacteraeota bacterium]|nr:peptide deformylase [Candidatus Dormibacteraeota bacterium]